MYEQFYGFSGRPFQLAPDPEFYFESLTHRKALSYLGYGLAQSEGFIVITGEIGAGKSTLAAHLIASVDRARLTVGQIVTSRLDGDDLVHMAAQAFGLPAHADKTQALAALERFFQDEARAGRRSLLIVDEAQNLATDALEELRMLSNFHLGAHPLLQIVLLGQPEFRVVLDDPRFEQLRQRVIATHHLDAMEPGEVGPYIEHRLARVGWKGDPAFVGEVYARLAAASGGVPRRINQLVNRLLLVGAVDCAHRIDDAMLDEALADLAGDASAADHPVAAIPAESAPATGDMLAALRRELAQRDERIAELQNAVMELAAQSPVPAISAVPPAELEPLLAGLVEANRRIETLEARTSDQSEAIRHVLTMLIEWLEAENAAARAA